MNKRESTLLNSSQFFCSLNIFYNLDSIWTFISQMQAVSIFVPVPVTQKELPQRSRRGALADISNQSTEVSASKKSETSIKVSLIFPPSN